MSELSALSHVVTRLRSRGELPPIVQDSDQLLTPLQARQAQTRRGLLRQFLIESNVREFELQRRRPALVDVVPEILDVVPEILATQPIVPMDIGAVVPERTPLLRRPITDTLTPVSCFRKVWHWVKTSVMSVKRMRLAQPKSNAQECSICLTVNPQWAAGVCGHVCCRPCLQRIAAFGGRCPYCRISVTEIRDLFFP
jgi:hypothetical protein